MGRTGQLCLRGIERYRTSKLARRSQGCCRFTPTCSHYAERALRERQLLMALLLIVRRVLRCRAAVPLGTVDAVGERVSMAKVRAVLLLSALVTLATVGLAQAVARPGMVAGRVTTTQGGCTMTLDGADIGGFNRNHPLVVRKGQRIAVAGYGPQSVRNAPEPAGSRTDFTFNINLVSPYDLSTHTSSANGFRTFSVSKNVDDYLKYGSGLYRVNGVATGYALSSETAYQCGATFYIKLDGNTAPEVIAGLVVLAGLGGAATSGGPADWAPQDLAPVDSGAPPADVMEDSAPRDAAKALVPDYKTNRREALAAGGCAAVIIGILLGTHGGDAGFAAMAAPVEPNNGRVRRRGRPVRGFFSGLLMGLGATAFMQQHGTWILTWQNTIAFPLALAVLFAVRGWRGKAFIPQA